jgi:transposase-like protein
MPPGPTYSKEQKAQAVALAANIGPLKAALQLGYHPRTVSRWTHEPAASPIIAAVEVTIADRLAEAHELGLSVIRARLTDPRARLGEIAQAVRVLGEQRLLAEGRSNLNIDVHQNVAANLIDDLSPDEQMALRRQIDDWQASQDNADAIDTALEDPFTLTPQQIDGLIRAIEAKLQ